jgi:hypothetical protein
MEVQDALSLIEDEAGKLPHPSAALLTAFVRRAVDPSAAARYVKKRLSDEGPSPILSDWVYIVSWGESRITFPFPDVCAVLVCLFIT